MDWMKVDEEISAVNISSSHHVILRKTSARVLIGCLDLGNNYFYEFPVSYLPDNNHRV